MKRIAFLSLILAITSPFWVNAQYEDGAPTTSPLRGYVSDTDRNAIPQAIIKYQQTMGGNAKGETVADWAGNFEVPNLTPGQYTLSVSKKGYLPRKDIPFVIIAGTDTVVPVKMSKKAGLLARLFGKNEKEKRIQVFGIPLKMTSFRHGCGPKADILTIANPKSGNSYGTMAFNDEVVVMEELLGKLQNIPKTSIDPLVISPQRGVSHEQIVKILDLVKQAKIRKIRFAKAKLSYKKPPPESAPSFTPEKIEEPKKQDSPRSSPVEPEIEIEEMQILKHQVRYGLIKGTVTTLNGNPIVQARMEYLGPNTSGTVETDDAGRYKIRVEKHGQYLLRAIKNGYKKKEYTVLGYTMRVKIRDFQLIGKGEKAPELKALPPPFKIEIPTSKFIEELQVKRFIVYIDAKGRMSVDDKIIPTLDALRKYLTMNEEEIDFTLIIKADKRTKYGVVMDVINQAKVLNIEGIAFAVEPVKAER